MKLTVKREEILRPLQAVSGAVERRQTLPILANVLLVAQEENQLVITATDLEVELTGRVMLDALEEPSAITVSAKKLLDICRTLPENSVITLATEKDRLIVRSGKSRFILYTLPTDKFPNVEESKVEAEFTVPQKTLKSMIEKVQFSMAQQDVRYYLMGMLFSVNQSGLTLASTDGHRLSVGELKKSEFLDVKAENLQVIVPRKGVIELMRLLEDTETPVKIAISSNHISAFTPEFTFISKLIEGRYPDYKRVIPQMGSKVMRVNREEFKRALVCVSILSSEKGRGVRLLLSEQSLKIFTNNPEQEEAEEELKVEYSGAEFEVGFNVDYLIDICNVKKDSEFQIIFSDKDDSILVEDTDDGHAYTYVVKPMRL